MDSIALQQPAEPGLISIVMPTRNGARFIGDTLASIGRQNYPHWELIVVEDGSNDGTREIVEAFARRHPSNRVDYSRNERNCGASAARNKAFTKCAGEFVALLDSDDRWLPDHLELAAGALQHTDADIVYSTVLMVEDETELVLGTWGPSADELRNFPQSLLGRSFVTPSASVLRREVLADVGPWSTAHRYCEDFDYWLRCVEANKRFHCIGGCHCLYRKNHQGATTQKLCGLLEEVAQTTEAHLSISGIQPKRARKYASNAYLLAARLHATADPAKDPSADPGRAPQLTLKGWSLRPTRIKHLVRGLWLAGMESIRRRPAPAVAPPAISRTISRPPSRRTAA